MRDSAVRLAWFGAIGVLATALHYATVVALVRGAGWNPLAANVAGWLAAFAGSFAGHYFKTFREPGLRAAVALPRFFAIALAGFLANQALYGLLLGHTPLRYDLAVIVVAIVVAVMTYLLSRHWGFKPVEQTEIQTKPL